MNHIKRRLLAVLMSGGLVATGALLSISTFWGGFFFILGFWANGFICASIIAKERADIANQVNYEMQKRGLPAVVK